MMKKLKNNIKNHEFYNKNIIFTIIYLSCFFKILWNPVKFIFTYFSNLNNRKLRSAIRDEKLWKCIDSEKCHKDDRWKKRRFFFDQIRYKDTDSEEDNKNESACFKLNQENTE